VAVAVEQEPSVVLDEEYRIVEVNSAAETAFGPLLGSCVWDCFPGSEAMYRPYYERARREGQPIELVQYYGGYITRVEVVPGAGHIRVAWETLSMLDTRNLEALRASLSGAIDALDKRMADLERKRVRSSLRVVGGRS
jgi:hypothetical protein